MNSIASIAVGLVAGVALVVSYGDHIRPSGARSGASAAVDVVAGTSAAQAAIPPIKLGPVDVNVTNAIAVAGPIRVITADTDANQQVHGSFQPESLVWTPLAAGPLVLTDLAIVRFDGQENPGAMLGIGTEGVADCSSGGSFELAVTERAPIHGGRFFVPAGSYLCGWPELDGLVIWSGYRPY